MIQLVVSLLLFFVYSTFVGLEARRRGRSLGFWFWLTMFGAPALSVAVLMMFPSREFENVESVERANLARELRANQAYRRGADGTIVPLESISDDETICNEEVEEIQS